MCSASWNVFWYRIDQSSFQLSEQLSEREFARLHRDKCNLRLLMLVCCRTLMINVGAVWSVYVLCACLVVCLSVYLSDANFVVSAWCSRFLWGAAGSANGGIAEHQCKRS